MTMDKTKTQSAQYTLFVSELKLVDKHPYLEVILQSDLTFGSHINKIVLKATGLVGTLRRVLKDVNTKTKLVAFNTLVRPILEYG